MKRIRALALVSLLLLAAAGTAFAQSTMEREVRAAASRLQAAFLEGQPADFRLSLGSVGFEAAEPSPELARAAKAAAILFEKAFSRSSRFVLVERRELGRLLEERELALSGLVGGLEGQAPDPALLGAADVLLYGEASYEEGRVRVTAKLVDAATGRLAAEGFLVEAAESSAEARRLEELAYVARYGVGLRLEGLGYTFAGDEVGPSLLFGDESGVTGLVRMPSFMVAYRPAKCLALGLGAERIDGCLWTGNVTWNIPDATPTTDTAFLRIVSSGWGVQAEAKGVLELSRRLNLFAGGAVEGLFLSHDGYFPDGSASAGKGFGLNNYGPRLDSASLAFRLLAGAEYFLAPRLALSLRGGYEFGKVELDTAPLWHLSSGLPSDLELDLGGPSFAAALSLRF